MVGWRIDEDYVVDWNVWATEEAEESCILAGGCEAFDVTLSVDGSQRVGGEDFDVGGVLD
jgi:hypothetical protein